MPANPTVLPFRALRYNPSIVGDLSLVITPPYDVISPEMQKVFYEKSPYNFVRVDLARDPGDIRYTAAQRVFQEWVRKQVLIKDQRPTFYFHEHSFSLPDGRRMTRRGFFGLRRLEDFSKGGIKPHERTLEGPKVDRLKLTRAVCANLSPVFSLYSDPDMQVDHLVLKLKNQKANIDFTDENGSRHQLWIESNPTVCQFVSKFFLEQPLLIADGHHRYETAINYQGECEGQRLEGTQDAPFNYVLMYFSNMSDEGLIILPIHRAVHSLFGFNPETFLKRLEAYFKVTCLGKRKGEEYLGALEVERQGAYAFIMLTKDSDKSYLLSMRKRIWDESPVSAALPQPLVGLDVTVLHRLIFEEILRISPDAQAREENILYWKETEKAIKETWEGACQLTFLLSPTRIEDMERVAFSGEVMPQKSTYFYPKVPSGLVIHSLMPDP